MLIIGALSPNFLYAFHAAFPKVTLLFSRANSSAGLKICGAEISSIIERASESCWDFKKGRLTWFPFFFISLIPSIHLSEISCNFCFWRWSEYLYALLYIVLNADSTLSRKIFALWSWLSATPCSGVNFTFSPLLIFWITGANLANGSTIKSSACFLYCSIPVIELSHSVLFIESISFSTVLTSFSFKCG